MQQGVQEWVGAGGRCKHQQRSSFMAQVQQQHTPWNMLRSLSRLTSLPTVTLPRKDTLSSLSVAPNWLITFCDAAGPASASRCGGCLGSDAVALLDRHGKR
jgi:hypothetical protein